MTLRIIQLVLTARNAPVVSKLVDCLRWKYKVYSTGLESASNMQLLVGYLRWKFRLISTGLWSAASDDVFTWVFTELLEQSSYTVGGMERYSGWVVVRIATRNVLNLKDQDWRNQALLRAHPSNAVKLLVLVNWQLVLPSGSLLTFVLLLVVKKGVADLNYPTAHKFNIGANRSTLSTTYLMEMSTMGSGPLVNITRRTTTLGYHYLTRKNGQSFVELGKEVLSFEDKCLLMVNQILNVLAWIDYLRWKFKLFPTLLWSVQSLFGIYNIQVEDKLVEHKWRPTKPQQNLKWQLQVVGSQHCQLAMEKSKLSCLN